MQWAAAFGGHPASADRLLVSLPCLCLMLGGHGVANMACRAAVLMYVLQHGMQLDVLLIACAAGALTSRCAAGCVQALMCVWCSRRHRMAGVAYDVMLLMYELLFDVCNAVLMFVSGAGCSRVRRGAGCAQLWMI